VRKRSRNPHPALRDPQELAEKKIWFEADKRAEDVAAAKDDEEAKKRREGLVAHRASLEREAAVLKAAKANLDMSPTQRSLNQSRLAKLDALAGRDEGALEKVIGLLATFPQKGDYRPGRG
jgi:thioredoxin-like negative regulator of GroEL